VELEHRIAGAHLIADFRHDHDADRGIDRVLDAVAARAKRDGGPSNQLRVES
jgi:hypothetical protein